MRVFCFREAALVAGTVKFALGGDGGSASRALFGRSWRSIVGDDCDARPEFNGGGFKSKTGAQDAFSGVGSREEHDFGAMMEGGA